MAMNNKVIVRNEERTSMVLYGLIRKRSHGEGINRFFLLNKQGHPTFPPTKFRPGDDLYQALVRPMEEDLGLPGESYFPEEELPVIPNSGESIRYCLPFEQRNYTAIANLVNRMEHAE